MNLPPPPIALETIYRWRFLPICGSIDQVKEFVSYLNTCDQNIQFTHEASQDSVSFLDTVVHISNHEIYTDLHCKPTDSHNYLLFSSAHPRKCKESIPYSQYLRVRRICSRLCDFDKHMKEMTTHFIRRGYPIDLLEEAALRARRLDRTKLLDPSPNSSKDDQNTILITTYNPHSDPLKDIVTKKLGHPGEKPHHFTPSPKTLTVNPFNFTPKKFHYLGCKGFSLPLHFTNLEKMLYKY